MLPLRREEEVDLFEGDLAVVSFFGEVELGEALGGGLYLPDAAGSGDKEPSLLGTGSFFTVDSFFEASSFLAFSLSTDLSGDLVFLSS